MTKDKNTEDRNNRHTPTAPQEARGEKRSGQIKREENAIKAKETARNRGMRGTGEGETGMQRGQGHIQGR